MFLFKNLSLLDPNWKEARGGYEVLVEGDTIKEVSSKPIRSRAARKRPCRSSGSSDSSGTGNQEMRSVPTAASIPTLYTSR